MTYLTFPQFDPSEHSKLKFFVPGEQTPLPEGKGIVWQKVCKVVRTRWCIVVATLSACAVVLVVTLLLSLPPHDEAASTLELLPEDGEIAPQFPYEGNCSNVVLVLNHISHTLCTRCLVPFFVNLTTVCGIKFLDCVRRPLLKIIITK
jgi:hypothetical protein